MEVNKIKDNGIKHDRKEVNSGIGSEIIQQLKESQKENINRNRRIKNKSNFSLSNDTNRYNNDQLSSQNKIRSFNSESEVNINDLSLLTPNKIKEAVDLICLFVFLNHSNFSYQERDFFISHHVLHKLFLKTGILTNSNAKNRNHIKPNQFDLILKKVASKKSQFNSIQFFNLIIILASTEHKEDFANNPKIALMSYVKKYLSPIMNEIKNDNSPNSQYVYYSIEKKIINVTKSTIDDTVYLIMKSQYKSLTTLYKIYFPCELNCKRNDQMAFLIKESLTNLIELCKNYALTPLFISIEKIAIIYNCIIDQDNMVVKYDLSNIGNVFTLYTFFNFLIYVSDIIFENETEFLYERLMMLFKRMETSNGYAFTLKKASIGSNENFTLAIGDDIIDQISSKTMNSNVIRNGNHVPTIKSNEDIDINTNEDTNIVCIESNNRNNEKNTMKNRSIVDNRPKYNELIEEFFETYATIGDKMNFSQMSLTSFLKLIKDFGLFEIKKSVCQTVNTNSVTSRGRNVSHIPIQSEYLTESEVSLIFFRLCGRQKSRNDSMMTIKTYSHSNSIVSPPPLTMRNNKNDNNSNSNSNNISIKMTYDLFLQALKIIAIKLHPDLPDHEALLVFKSQDLALEETLKKPERGVTQIEELISNINNSDIKNILFDFQSSLNAIYSYYADSNNLIDFQSFFQFYKDFSIFPNIANLIEIKKMFFILLQIQTEGYKPQNTLNNSLKNSILAKYKSTKYDTLMKFDYFLYSLAIASRFVKGKEHTNEYEKLMYLISNIGITKGIYNNPKQLINSTSLNIVNKEMLEIIKAVKKKYPIHFPQNDKINLLLKSDNAYKQLFEDCE